MILRTNCHQPESCQNTALIMSFIPTQGSVYICEVDVCIHGY